MKTWSMNLDKMPIDEPILVFLAEKMTGMRIHAAKKMKTQNGYLMIVGGIFAFDAPQILCWRPMVDDPKQATIRENIT